MPRKYPGFQPEARCCAYPRGQKATTVHPWAFPSSSRNLCPSSGSFPESQFSSVLHGWQGGLARQEGSRRWGLLFGACWSSSQGPGCWPGQPLRLRGHGVGPGSLVPVSLFGRCSRAIAGRYSAGKHAPVPRGWGRARENTDSFPGLGNSAPRLSLAQRTVTSE